MGLIFEIRKPFNTSFASRRVVEVRKPKIDAALVNMELVFANAAHGPYMLRTRAHVWVCVWVCG